MRKLNIEMNIPENIDELKSLAGKVVGVIPRSIDSSPMPLVYFGSYNGTYEFLQEEINYDMVSEESFLSREIHSDIIPEIGLEFMERGIIFRKAYCVRNSKIYYPSDKDYKPRLLALKSNGLWLPTKRSVMR